MRKITHIIVHESDSSWGDAREIDKWHKERGWSEIGYHKVILNGQRSSRGVFNESEDGIIENGRPIEKTGAHALGFNSISLGFCLIGKGGQFTKKQMNSLVSLIMDYCIEYNIPLSNVLGHYEIPKSGGKVCPEIDMKIFREELQFRFENVGVKI